MCVHVGVNGCVSQWSAPVESSATRLLFRLYLSLGVRSDQRGCAACCLM
uniref:Uncharacterized protein n=1 Tax=Anguilla anguilla TaxID=7936 RepID=A0A0E9S6R2_ANGAN